MFKWLSRLFGWSKRTKEKQATLASVGLASLERIVLTDGVARTLFEDFAEHRRSARGDEEIGWVLMGLRQGTEAVALAALPAGAERDAGAAHVQFNSEAQALASRIIRQSDKRLAIIGVVHTHPGSMRSPSSGDLHGDSQWVANLRGGEGVFAIGTADARTQGRIDASNIQAYGDLCFSWCALGKGDARYRSLPVQVAIGNDLASPLRPVWNVIESHAEPLNKLSRLFAKVEYEAAKIADAPTLVVKIALAEPRQQIHLLLSDTGARYYWSVDKELIAVGADEGQLDRAVFLILAELAKGPIIKTAAMPTFV